MASPTGEAKRRLAELGKDIEKAAEKLGSLHGERDTLTSENERVRSENVNLAIEQENLQKDIDAKRLELAELERAKEEARMGTNTLGDEAAAHRRAVMDATKEESDTIARIASLKVSESEAVKSLSGRQALVDDTDKEVRRLTGVKVQLEQDEIAERAVLTKIEGRRSRIESGIRSALSQFRVFERRIGHLSRETGYLIPYDDPELLEDKDEDHG